MSPLYQYYNVSSFFWYAVVYVNRLSVSLYLCQYNKEYGRFKWDSARLQVWLGGAGVRCSQSQETEMDSDPLWTFPSNEESSEVSIAVSGAL